VLSGVQSRKVVVVLNTLNSTPGITKKKKKNGDGCIDPHFLDLGTSSLFGRFTPGERAPGVHWIGGWVGLRAGLDDMKK
jgi:hypothetical protein